ncbi:MAG: hypothetical protein Q8N99_08575 [Nanoarchaeota archaeon]|nr:hypothetical protein [Nanoarchaeota archaeon]
MANILLSPQWFFGYDIIFELAFAIISLLVCFISYKIYKLTEENSLKLFGISFLFISISYFIQSFFNFAIYSELSKNVVSLLSLSDINFFNLLGVYTNIIFFSLGLITLVYMTLKIKSPKTYSLLVIIPIFLLFMGCNKLYLYYALTSILLIYIAIYYFSNYINKRNLKSLLVFIAFDFLLFGQIHFIFSINHVLYYILGHFLELIAYLLILINLILIHKNGKKA